MNPENSANVKTPRQLHLCPVNDRDLVDPKIVAGKVVSLYSLTCSGEEQRLEPQQSTLTQISNVDLTATETDTDADLIEVGCGDAGCGSTDADLDTDSDLDTDVDTDSVNPITSTDTTLEATTLTETTLTDTLTDNTLTDTNAQTTTLTTADVISAAIENSDFSQKFCEKMYQSEIIYCNKKDASHVVLDAVIKARAELVLMSSKADYTPS